MSSDAVEAEERRATAVAQVRLRIRLADLEVKDSEKKLVRRMIQSLKLGDDEAKQVEGWLKRPPKPEEVDPNHVPRAHKKLFLDAARQVITADGEIDPAERENLELLEQLLG